jgi:hypothetical protein
MRLRSLSLAALLLAMPAAALAAPFGYSDEITRIEDVKAVGAADEALFIGHRVARYQLLLGLYLKDEGYVLGVRADPDRYYDMPTGNELKQYQQRGLLPETFPAYSIGVAGYALGYSFWPFLLIVLGGAGFGVRMLLPKKPAPAEDARTAVEAVEKAKGEMSPAFALLLALFKKRQAGEGAAG